VKTILRLIIYVGVCVCVWLVMRDLIMKKLSKDPVGFDHIVLNAFDFNKSDSLEIWDQKVLSRHATEYELTDFMGQKCVKADSDNSASTLYIKQKVPYEEWPFVSWDWIVEKFPDREDEETLGKKKEFDFGAQFYVVFYSKFFLKTKSIQYIWAEGLPVGSVADNPYTRNVKLLVLESGPSAEWKHEERNIKDDYRMLFGEDLNKNIDAIAFMTDSDSTRTDARAYYDNIKVGILGEQEEEMEHIKHMDEEDPGSEGGIAEKSRAILLNIKEKTAEIAARFLEWVSGLELPGKPGKEEPSNI